MKISVLGYGLMWSARPPRGCRDTAYFNTTGISVKGKPRSRACIYGYVRINQCLGFHPDNAARTVNRVYETDGLCIWCNRRKLFLRNVEPLGTVPDSYLVCISHNDVGYIDRSSCWLSESGEIVSFSEGNDQQEVLLILPAFGWIRGRAGLFYLMPETARPSLARLKHCGG
ncbi:MAG: hypothetical protein ACRD7E_22835 [Bryobacteraceae bacterium]